MQIKDLHPWNVSVAEAAKIQLELRGQVSLDDEFGELRFVAGVDVSARGDEGRAAVVILTFPGLEIVETATHAGPLPFPYIPGFLSFREAPLALAAFEKIERVPDMVIVDGQGIAHPRGLGIASHLGLFLDLPTIGCAKSRLVGTYEEPGRGKGSRSELLGREGRIGSVLRTRTGATPVFVSPGHKVGFDSSDRIVLACTTKYRLPEPTRDAHRLAGEKPQGV
ncbi:MAG: deoxyribonuclease V [Armatimonadota bacterium]